MLQQDPEGVDTRAWMLGTQVCRVWGLLMAPGGQEWPRAKLGIYGGSIVPSGIPISSGLGHELDQPGNVGQAS